MIKTAEQRIKNIVDYGFTQGAYAGSALAIGTFSLIEAWKGYQNDWQVTPEAATSIISRFTPIPDGPITTTASFGLIALGCVAMSKVAKRSVSAERSALTALINAPK